MSCRTAPRRDVSDLDVLGTVLRARRTLASANRGRYGARRTRPWLSWTDRFPNGCEVGTGCALPSPHRLRDTFASAAHEAGVDWYDLKVLMNHALPTSGDVTMGYVRVSVDHLREAAEKIAGFLSAKMEAAAPVGG